MQEVIPSGTVTFKWNLPKASKADRMCKLVHKWLWINDVSVCTICDRADVYSRNGTKHLPGIYAVNKTGELSGEASVKVMKFMTKWLLCAFAYSSYRCVSEDYNNYTFCSEDLHVVSQLYTCVIHTYAHT